MLLTVKREREIVLQHRFCSVIRLVYQNGLIEVLERLKSACVVEASQNDYLVKADSYYLQQIYNKVRILCLGVSRFLKNPV